jgi:hypothetical protein
MYKRYLLLSALIGILVLPIFNIAHASSGDSAAKGVEVKSFRLYGPLTKWEPLDKDSLIVWTTPSKAYLLDLRNGSSSLRNAQKIGITSTLNRVAAGQDKVVFDGFRYPIETIQSLDQADAKALVSEARKFRYQS